MDRSTLDTLEAILEDKALQRDVVRRIGRGGSRTAPDVGTLRELGMRHAAVRKIIETAGRPTYFVVNDAPQIQNASDGWEARLATCRDELRCAIRATARIEIDANGQTRFGGTAWLVAPRLLVTNRHVANRFAERRDDGSATIRVDDEGKPMRVRVDFVGENDVADDYLVSVEREIPYLAQEGEDVPDIAVLQLAEGPRLPDPVPLARETPPAGRDRWVVCIGYPADVTNEDQAALDEIFGKVFDVKRIAPGLIAETLPDRWYFGHDCSTLEGSSGSLLLDVESGCVVGLHFEGKRHRANHAVRVEHLHATLAPLLAARGQSLAERHVTRRGTVRSQSEVRAGPHRSAEVLQTRKGFEPLFLGKRTPVPLPRVVTHPEDRVTLLGSTDTVFQYTHFSLELRKSRRLPLWTAANVRPAGRENTTRIGWSNDPRASPDDQISASFYKRTKLSRGQMVRRLGAVWGDDWRDANDDTFVATNACPQVETFDDVMWAALEEHALYDCADDRRISVLAGPIFADDDPEIFGVQLPVRFWKIVAFCKEGRLTAGAFVTCREGQVDARRWAPYQWTIAALEKEIGLDFGDLRTVDREAAVAGSFQRKRRIYGVDELRF